MSYERRLRKPVCVTRVLESYVIYSLKQWRQETVMMRYRTSRSAFLFSASFCSFARRLSIAASLRCRFRSFFIRRRSITCCRRLRQRASRGGSRRATASVSSISRTIAASGYSPFSLSSPASPAACGKSSRMNPVDLQRKYDTFKLKHRAF